MCDPLTVGLGAIAIGSQVAGGIAANEAAKKQQRAITKAANATLDQQLTDLEARAQEERQAAQFEAQNQRELSLVELGLAQAGVADAGIAGSSVDALTGTLKRRANVAQTVTQTNLDSTLRQLERMAGGFRADRDSRIAGAPQPVSGGVIGLNALNFAAQLAIPYIRNGSGG